MANRVKSSVENQIRPYNPSWVDHFKNWVSGLPIHNWIFYLGCGILLIIIQVVFVWVEGRSTINALLSVIIFNSLGIPYCLALIQLLDKEAIKALHTMRPITKLDDRQFDLYVYKISTMPNRITLIVGLSLVFLMIMMEQLWVAPVRYDAFTDLHVFTIVFQIIDKIGVFIFGAFIYHTVHQSVLVDRIYTHHTHITLFDMKPLYAFSRLTALTAIGLIVGIYGWGIINPDILADPVSLGFMVIITILAVATFIWPLFGAHRILEKEKYKLLSDIDLRFEAAFKIFNQRFDANDLNGFEPINGTISSLAFQQKIISAIPTWPWKPETARGVFTAIALPLVLRIIQFFVEQTFGL